MSTKVRMKPSSTLKAELGLQPDGEVQSYFTGLCAEYIDKYVPYREGNLSNYKILGRYIIYDTPYARYMYEGKVMGPNIPIYEDGVLVGWWSKAPKYLTDRDINYIPSVGHEYAGPHWDRRMWSAEKDDVIKKVQRFVNRGGN